jgi:hypothetical protein
MPSIPITLIGDPSLSPCLESDINTLSSEISFESTGSNTPSLPDTDMHFDLPTAIDMNLDGLKVHPIYSGPDRIVILQVCSVCHLCDRTSLLTSLKIHQVEDTLFYVDKFFFIRDSPFFKRLLVCDGTNACFAPVQKPIRLESNVKSVDFERLLSILYPLYAVNLNVSLTLLLTNLKGFWEVLSFDT